jgi:hypothetical protein
MFSATGEAHIILQIRRHEKVMSAVIDTPERESRPEMILWFSENPHTWRMNDFHAPS